MDSESLTVFDESIRVQEEKEKSAFQTYASTQSSSQIARVKRDMQNSAFRLVLPSTVERWQNASETSLPGLHNFNSLDGLNGRYNGNTNGIGESTYLQSCVPPRYYEVEPRYLYGRYGNKSEDQRNPNKIAKCRICKKTFARASTLKVHMRIHLGEKPFRCAYCGKAFAQSGNLTTHIRVHTGEKPYPCHVCGKRFTQLSSQKTHMKIHNRKGQETKQ